MTAYQFFKANAGYSYTPGKETENQGRARCARMLAKAERHASKAGYSFQWSPDGLTSLEWMDEGEEYATWQCLARDAGGAVVASICGVDFGDGGEPWGDPYRRVIEAELSLESM